jgi:multicomponent Na+:H+ antiporter subunit D
MLERNVKRLFAFSSVAQIGYIVLGVSLLTETGLIAGIVHFFNHALAKCAAFLAMAAFAFAAASLKIEDLRGLAKQMPLTFVAFVIAGISLIGVPGTAGFISKWYLISAALEMGAIGIVLIAVILISSLMAVVYVWRVAEAVAFGERPQDAPAVAVPPVLVIALWAIALANIYFGLVPELPVGLASEASQTLLEHMQ